MNKIRIPHLSIEGFRGFEKLTIEKFGRVNLITGDNNVGKSSLLEALYLYSKGGELSAFREILDNRQEYLIRTEPLSREEERSMRYERSYPHYNPQYLFFGRKSLENTSTPIVIKSQDTLQVEIESSIRSNELEQRSLEFELENVEDVAALQRLSVTFNSDKNTYPLQILNYRTGNYRIRSNIVSLPTMLVRINGVSAEALVTLWNDVQLTALESNVLEALRLIEPRLERLSFRLDEGRNMSPFPIAKFKHLLEPIPLRNMGDGMQRLFGIALALVNAKEGILLIDEVENGLHYSVQPKVWKLVFKMAKQLNVQVFATTHSLDTIQSFQKAADEDKEEGMLIRLREKQGVLKAVTFDEGDLEVITESFLEVR